MQFIQTKARILTPDSSRKFATSWEYTRPEPHHIIHNLTRTTPQHPQSQDIKEFGWNKPLKVCGMKNYHCWCWPISPVYKKAPGSLHTGWCSDVKCSCWLSWCLVEHHAHEKHTVSMLHIYRRGWKEPIMWFGTTYINNRSSAMTGRLLRLVIQSRRFSMVFTSTLQEGKHPNFTGHGVGLIEWWNFSRL